MPLDATGYVQSPRVLTVEEWDNLFVLKEARHRIRHRWRWWHGNAPWPFRHCAVTAVSSTVFHDRRLALPVVMRLADCLPPGWTFVQDYNDAPSTTHADILSLFDRAIAELEE
jgi:hypothetical protein